MTTSYPRPEQQPGPLTADDLRRVEFSTGSMLHPGYTQAEVDGFLARAADEVAALTAENAQLHERIRALEEQVASAPAAPSPSDQAVGILATAQLTADQYVAEAEEFSRQVTSEARAQYEEQLAEAREKAGAIIQAASEARAAIASSGGGVQAGPDTAQLREEAAYLRAFGQACRVQLRSYLEALLADVESEWGRAHPAALPPLPSAPDRGGLPAAANEVADLSGPDRTPNGATAAPVPVTHAAS